MKCGHTSRAPAFRLQRGVRPHFIFQGTPDDSAPQVRAYPEPLTLNSALLGHRLLSSDRGRFYTTADVTAGISWTL